MRNAQLEIDRDFEMPSIPLVVTKILQVADSDQSSADDLEDILLHDPVLSARILRLANSALYSFRSDVRTLAHAIALLGVNLVKSLAIGVQLFDIFAKGMKSEAALLNQLWMHSFGVGLLTQRVWALRNGRREAEFAFMCGLMHDMGKAVYFKTDAVGYAEIFARSKKDSDPDMCHLEAERYSVDHAGVGAILAKRWGLPAELSAAIGRHHAPTESVEPLVVAIQLADRLAREAEIGYDGDASPTSDSEQFRTILGMSDEQYEKLGAFAREKRAAVMDFFAEGS